MGVVLQTSSHRLESLERCWQIDTRKCYDISWGAHSSDCTSSDYVYLSWHVTDRDLVGRLLDFDILITHKFTLFDLKN